jgi:mRNA interferase RelE/StbE
MAKLVIHTRAGRYIERLDARIKAQLIRKLKDLAKNPGAMSGVKPMAGEWSGFYRLRHADLRVIYLYDRTSDTVVIAHVGPRGDVYK